MARLDFLHMCNQSVCRVSVLCVLQDELTRAAGTVASHFLVTTEDGYQVMLHRLGNNSGPAVLLQHGLLNAADIWLIRGPDSDLAYLLLREGYDVYLGNMRGNAFSRRHLSLRPSDALFWDFSFHESGYYDVPAMVDWILRSRGLDQLFYVGHSLGTTVFFVMCSTRPEYNAKIRAAVMLSPVAYVPDHSEFAVGFLRLAVLNRQNIWRSFKQARLLDFMPRTSSSIKAAYDFCGYRKPTQDFCLDLFGFYVGEHRANIDRKRIAYQLSFSPTGTSLKTIFHLSQLFQSSKFGQLDLGPAKNLEKYNSSVAPAYRLDRVTAPVALFWSYNDNLVSERSVSRLRSSLPNVVLVKAIADPKFTHADVFVGMNAKQMVYDDVVATINSYR